MITKKIVGPAGKTWHKIYTLPSSDLTNYYARGAVFGSKCFISFDSDDESDVGTYVIDLNDPNYTPTRILHACFSDILQLPSGRLIFMSNWNTWGGPVTVSYYSDDNGENWQPTNLSSENGYRGSSAPVLLPQGRLIAICYIDKQGYKLMYSDDSGETWVLTNIRADDDLTVSPSGKIFFTINTEIYYTDDLEVSHLIEAIDDDDDDNDVGICKADYIIAIDNNAILFSKSYNNSFGTYVYRLSFNSTDSQWHKNLIYTNASIKNAILWNIHNRICLQGNNSTYYSDDNGGTWQQKPSDKFLPLVYNIYNDKMYACNHGNIYCSDLETLSKYNSKPLTCKQAKELVQWCKAYVQALKNGN